MIATQVLNMNPDYQIIVKNKAGDVLGEITGFLNLKFGDRLNDYGTATFDLPIESPDLVNLISLCSYEIYIQRDGRTLWSGEQKLRKVRIQANDPCLVTITSYTLISMLKDRLTERAISYDANFVQVEQGAILKHLVDVSQAKTDGDYGFTFAAIPDVMLRDRGYDKDNIFDCFVNMSNVINGIDFWCDHNKVIHFSARRGVDRSNEYGFELGINMLQPGITDDFSSPANTGFVLGAGLPPDQLIGNYVDTGARNTYKLREQKISQVDVSEQDTLDGKAEELVNTNKEQIRTVDFQQIPNTNPEFGVLDTGDSAGVTLHKGPYSINKPFRITGYDVAIGKNGDETVSWIVSGS